MPQYRYRALAQGGEIVVGEVEAPSDDEVLRRIEYLGHLPIYVAMVRAGEASGPLEPVLRAIVEDRTRRELLADRINSAVRYPLFLVGTAVAVLAFFLIYVVPQFEPVFKDLGGKLNAGAAFVLSASSWLRGNLDLVLGASILTVLGALMVANKREWRARLFAALSSLPGIAGTVRD